jgi:FkbM family methyltransferase
MLNNTISFIRKKHPRLSPLYHLRKQRFFVDWIKPSFDFVIPINLYRITWKVYVKIIRNLSWVINSKGLNRELSSLFLAINKIYQPKTFWDIGANIGFFSWLLLNQDREKQVVLFEADPDNISLLQKTIKLANINALLIDCAVSDRVGEASFAVDRVIGATGTLEVDRQVFIQRQYQINPSFIKVKTITLDYFLSQGNSFIPELIKIDVEGSEYKVFEGAINLIETHQPIIIFECLSENKDDLLSHLRNLDYKIFDAENPKLNEQNIANSFNILALPVRCHYLIDLLFETWQFEYLQY